MCWYVCVEVRVGGAGYECVCKCACNLQDAAHICSILKSLSHTPALFVALAVFSLPFKLTHTRIPPLWTAQCACHR